MNPKILRRGVMLTLVALVAYGSLFPFQFQSVNGDLGTLLAGFFGRWGSDGRLTDLLGNVALFMPLGLAAGYRFDAEPVRAPALLFTLLWLTLFATALQIAQLWLPDRNAALSDVFWNLVGTVAGLVAARALTGVRLRFQAHPAVLLLLAGWLLSQTAPLVPALGWQEFKDSLKPLLLHPEFDLGWYLLQTAMALAAARLLQAVPRIGGSPARFGLLLLVVLGLQLVVARRAVEFTVVLAFASAWLLWSVWLRRAANQHRWIVIGLLSAFTVWQVLPLELTAHLRAFHWLPFEAPLRGSILAAAINISGLLFLFGALFWFLAESGGRVGPVAVAVAAWVLLLELAQTVMIAHTPDVTPVVLVLLAAVAVRVLSRVAPTAATEPPVAAALRASSTARTASAPERGIGPQNARRPVLLGAALVLGMAAVSQWLVGLAGVPYNVRELFLGDGILFKVVFAAAILWFGAGSAWMAWRLAHASRPWLTLPMWWLVVGLVSLLLLSLSVSDESLMDVAGSSNMHWFIIHRQIWGAGMAEVLRALDMPALVAWIERVVRYQALVGPLILTLALFGVTWLGHRRHRFTPAGWLVLVLAALPWYWLCKAIAFDWSSTDNLNELIARDAAWGLGGGLYLYLLLLLLAVNVVLVATVRRGHGWVLRGVVTLLALPVSWWLFTHGLDPAVEKYGQVFSGAQFLLGPDRTQTLSTAALFGRWVALYLGGLGVLAAGFGLTLQWLQARAGRTAGQAVRSSPPGVSSVDAPDASR